MGSLNVVLESLSGLHEHYIKNRQWHRSARAVARYRGWVL